VEGVGKVFGSPMPFRFQINDISAVPGRLPHGRSGKAVRFAAWPGDNVQQSPQGEDWLRGLAGSLGHHRLG
jgi:hypothetical protein